MSSLFDDLQEGLTQAIEAERKGVQLKQTKITIAPQKAYQGSDVKRIRNTVGMSQSMFAEYMGVSKKTIEAWERGVNQPKGPACRLLSILETVEFQKLPFIG